MKLMDRGELMIKLAPKKTAAHTFPRAFLVPWLLALFAMADLPQRVARDAAKQQARLPDLRERGGAGLLWRGH